MKCAGLHLSTGEPCGAHGKHACRGKVYCVTHYAVASKEPQRFRDAMERWVRREARKEERLRSLDAQMDAFPETVESGGGVHAQVP